MVYFALGLLTGIITMAIGIYYLTVGTLRIDQISADRDLYRFEIDNLDELSNKKYIVLKVDPNADLSHD